MEDNDGNIVNKYRYVSIFLDIEGIDRKIKISINIEKRNVMKKSKSKKLHGNPEARWVVGH